MKKALIVILIICLVGGGIAGIYFFNYNKDKTLKIGYSKISITPSYSVPLAGSGASETRMSTGIKDNIYATCIAFRDSKDQIAVILTLDLLHMSDENNNVYSSIVNQITSDHGISKNRIIVSATHCHSAPDIFSTHTSIKNQYLPELYSKIKTVVNDAIYDCKTSKSSEFSAGEIEIQHLNFVRRYFDQYGGFVGVNWDNSNTPIIHESQVDNKLQVIKFKRQGMKDVILVNWAAHAATVGGTVISGDYISYFRSSVENAGYDIAFFQGASGNVAPTSEIEDEIQYNRGTKEYGELLAQALLNKIEDDSIFEDISLNGTLTGSLVEYCVFYDDTDYANVEKAIEIFEDFTTGEITLENANAEAKKYGFSSVYECGKVRFVKKMTTETSVNIPLVVITFSDLAFASAPYEMFCQNGVNIRKESKAKTTFVITNANGSNSYIPSRASFANKGYEVAVCQFKKGTAELLEAKFVEIINANY